MNDEAAVSARRYPMHNQTQAQYSCQLAWRDYHAAKITHAQLRSVLVRYSELYGDE